MARLLLILLVMLIPLRGWSAERMAVQMTSSQVSMVVAAGAVAMEAMPADCPMLAQPASEAEKSPFPSKSHVGCQTCQLCMSLAAQSFPFPHLLAYERHAPPVSAAAHFLSADLARQAKPPIL